MFSSFGFNTPASSEMAATQRQVFDKLKDAVKQLLSVSKEGMEFRKLEDDLIEYNGVCNYKGAGYGSWGEFLYAIKDILVVGHYPHEDPSSFGTRLFLFLNRYVGTANSDVDDIVKLVQGQEKTKAKKRRDGTTNAPTMRQLILCDAYMLKNRKTKTSNSSYMPSSASSSTSTSNFRPSFPSKRPTPRPISGPNNLPQFGKPSAASRPLPMPISTRASTPASPKPTFTPFKHPGTALSKPKTSDNNSNDNTAAASSSSNHSQSNGWQNQHSTGGTSSRPPPPPSLFPNKWDDFDEPARPLPSIYNVPVRQNYTYMVRGLDEDNDDDDDPYGMHSDSSSDDYPMVKPMAVPEVVKPIAVPVPEEKPIAVPEEKPKPIADSKKPTKEMVIDDDLFNLILAEALATSDDGVVKPIAVPEEKPIVVPEEKPIAVPMEKPTKEMVIDDDLFNQILAEALETSGDGEMSVPSSFPQEETMLEKTFKSENENQESHPQQQQQTSSSGGIALRSFNLARVPPPAIELSRGRGGYGRGLPFERYREVVRACENGTFDPTDPKFQIGGGRGRGQRC